MRVLLTPSLLVVLLVSAFVHAVSAKPVTCQTSVAGGAISEEYDSKDSVLRENRSYRERLFGGFGTITCPGFVTLRALTPGLTDPQRDPFCLQYDKSTRTYTGFVVGARDAYVGCRKPSKSFCQRVNAGRDTALAVARYGAGIVSGADQAAQDAGLTAIARASGAVILSGPRDYLIQGLVSVGAKALAVATAPGTATASAVTVVTVGGLLYACGE